MDTTLLELQQHLSSRLQEILNTKCFEESVIPYGKCTIGSCFAKLLTELNLQFH